MSVFLVFAGCKASKLYCQFHPKQISGGIRAYVLVLEVSQNGPDSSKVISEITDKVCLSSRKRILRIFVSESHLRFSIFFFFFLLVTNIF